MYEKIENIKTNEKPSQHSFGRKTLFSNFAGHLLQGNFYTLFPGQNKMALLLILNGSDLVDTSLKTEENEQNDEKWYFC
jgi:hypothetical protein